MRLPSQQQPEIMLSGPISTSGSSGTAELRQFDHDPRACAALPSVDTLHSGGGGRRQQTTLRSRPRIRILGAACGRSIAAGVRQANALAIGIREEAKRS
jgi:hypothetical protein